MVKKAVELLPGLVVLFLVGLIAKYMAGSIPYANYVIIAIILGFVWGNSAPVPSILWPGINTYRFWLYLGIVFLGARLVMQEMIRMGAIALSMVVVEIIISIAVVRYVARNFGISDKLASLLATGVGICGVSAIIGCSGAIDADEKDTSYAIAIILIFGAAAIVFYALIGQLIGMGPLSYGFWAGLAIDNTAEVMAGAEFYDGILRQNGLLGEVSTATTAALVKNGRNALMGLVILGFAIYYARRGMAEDIEHKGMFLWNNFPKFVLGFLLFSLLSTIGFFGEAEIKSLKHLYKWVFMMTFVGVGFNTRIDDMKKIGFKPFVVGVMLEGLVALVTLGMVLVVYGTS